MTSVQNVSEMQDALKDALKTHWKLFLFQGVVMVILGILAVAWPAVATLAVDIYIGWLFLISGTVDSWRCFRLATSQRSFRRFSRRLWRWQSASC
jgi:uncharacterized membrane protein HdeD (DUF308 family)